MKRFLRSSIALLLTLHCCAFSTTAARADGDDEPKLDAVIFGNNNFALDAWKKLPDDQNLIWSPFNFRMAMTVCYYGARGETADEMCKTLTIDPNVKGMQFAKVAVKAIRTKGDEVKFANGFWVEDSVKVNDFYRAFLTGLGAKCETVPFAKESDKIRESINSWVSEKTAEKIKDLFKPGTIDPSTKCVIASTIYFKADWKKSFIKELSKNADFQLANRSKDTIKPHGSTTISVPFMEVHGFFQYAKTDDVEVVTIPYKGDELVMSIVLPQNPRVSLDEAFLEKVGLASILTGKYSTTKENQDAVNLLRMKNKDLMIVMPKWKQSCEVKGTSLLKDMGMKAAFTSEADFSGAFGKDSKIYLSEVVHKAFIEVDEKGTEAAAATGVVARDLAIIEKAKALKIDHPFIYFIRHEQTGAILFMGRMENPKEN